MLLPAMEHWGIAKMSSIFPGKHSEGKFRLIYHGGTYELRLSYPFIELISQILHEILTNFIQDYEISTLNCIQ